MLDFETKVQKYRDKFQQMGYESKLRILLSICYEDYKKKVADRRKTSFEQFMTKKDKAFMTALSEEGKEFILRGVENEHS